LADYELEVLKQELSNKCDEIPELITITLDPLFVREREALYNVYSKGNSLWEERVVIRGRALENCECWRVALFDMKNV